MYILNINELNFIVKCKQIFHQIDFNIYVTMPLEYYWRAMIIEASGVLHKPADCLYKYHYRPGLM